MNLFSGCVSIVLAFHGFFLWALLFILLAGVFDFCDGMAARLLHTSSVIGKELDSLADVVSFGLAPSMIIFKHIDNISDSEWVMFLAFFIAVFSALRLAKFNVDTRQTSSFIGLPTPPNAIFFASLLSITDPMMPVPSYLGREMFMPILNNLWVILFLVAIFSYLLVAEIPMFSLKFKNLSWSDNKVRFIFLILSALLLIVFQLAAFPFIILLYLVMSVVTAYKA
ncbi:MAG: CDP-diacylglycerol--serine O-phosphatidyltransferase [Paludibacteraceae bacterium]|nr:CDP-diacylglycerol--serine O-phosphatidyltransferase [Paludibacteraceae bacterium]